MSQPQFEKIWPESESRIDEYFVFLHLLEKKGFYEILERVGKEDGVSYKQIEDFAVHMNLVNHNKTPVRIILNALSNMGLIEPNSEPLPHTTYRITDFGRKI